MELWDVYDVDRQLTGKTMVRGETFEEGAYHLVVHVCVFNSEGKMLIQQRQPFKHGWSGMWDVTCGGSAIQGESSRDAAHRELLEEVGIDIDFSGSRPDMTTNFEHGFNDIYIVQKDVDISTLELQYEEVKAVKWASCEEIFSMIDDGTFIPRYKSFMHLLFDKRKGEKGCIEKKMETVVKQFEELTTEELYEILKLRSKVFVVEQDCVYQDIDDKDKGAWHVFLRDDDGLEAYLRVLDKGVAFEEASIGRVVTKKRKQGFGKTVMEVGMKIAVEMFGADRIKIVAQCYAEGFYQKMGFVTVSEEFMYDGIPHVYMIWTKQ